MIANAEKVNVAILDDHSLFRKGISIMLEDNRHEIMISSCDLPDFIEQLRSN